MTLSIRTNPVLCNVCGSGDTKPILRGIDRLHGFEGQFQYVQCKSCGLVYMNPQIAPEDIGQFYPADYAPHQSGSVVENKTGARPDLPRLVLNSLNSDSKALDVGCGSGTFLYQLREFCHCRVNGIDFSENAVLFAQKKYGLDVFHGEISAAPFEEKSFDLITAFHFIEHVHDPAKTIKKAFTLCKTSGHLVLRTPNYYSLCAKLFKDKWYPLDCPRHLYIFSPSSLTTLLEKSGFEVIKVDFETSSKSWLGSLQYVFYGDNFNPRTKNKLRRSSLARVSVSPVSHLAALLNQGDIMIVTAQRKK